MAKTKLYTFIWVFMGPLHVFKMASLAVSLHGYTVLAHEESENLTNLPHSFTKEGLLQLPG